MTGLDTTILVQLAIADHPANQATVAAVQKEATSGSILVFPALVVTEFPHVVTDQRRFSPPMTIIEAVDWMNSLLQNPNVMLLDTTSSSITQALLWIQQFNLGRKRIIDTHLAAVLHTSGATRLLTSNPADFAIFAVFEILIPVLTSSPPAP